MRFGLGEWGCRPEGDPCHAHLPTSDVYLLEAWIPRWGIWSYTFPPTQDEAKVLALLEELLAGSPTPGSAQLQVDPQQKKKKVTRV